MADIRITPAASIMAFTSSLNYKETLTQDASGSIVLAGSGSTGRTNLFAIDGNNGRLFSVDDDLSDSLFSVNTIAGLPVIEAFADNSVILGKYGAAPIVISGSDNSIQLSGSIKAINLPSTSDTVVVTYNTTTKQLGYNTVAGPSGISGLSGTSGISGLSGTSGISGLSGTSGISGLSGTSGISGLSGTSGISGLSGASGISGLSGQSGISGLSGTSGISGLSGTSGISGISGTSGISGLSGRSGISGTNGTNGTNGTSFTWQGTWDPGTAYRTNDVVYHNGSSYIALRNTIGDDPETSPAQWELMALSGLSGTSGISGLSGISGVLSLSGATDNGVITLNGTSPNATVESNLIFNGTNLKISGGSELLRLQNDGAYISFYNSANTVRTGYIQFNANANTVIMTENAASNILFGTNSTTRMFITASGNVYINNELFVNTVRIGAKNTDSMFVGTQALNALTTGGGDTAVGYQSMLNGTGFQNTAIGAYTLYSLTTTTGNTAVGYGAAIYLVSGEYNTALGTSALRAAAVGTRNASYNTSLGYNSGFAITTGNYNTFVGSYAGYSITTGTNNILIGSGSGASITTGNNNTIIGKYTGTSTLTSTVVLADGTGSVYLYGTLNRVAINKSTTPNATLDVNGNLYTSNEAEIGGNMYSDSIKTNPPASTGVNGEWRLGEAVGIFPVSIGNYARIEIEGAVYYLALYQAE